MRGNYPNANVQNENASPAQRDQSLQNEINRHWEAMPPQVRPFLRKQPDVLNLPALTKFWNNPVMIGYTRGKMAVSVCGASWFIATQYLKMGMMREAGALILNGSFLHQCYHTHIEIIVKLLGDDRSNTITHGELPLFSQGFMAVRSSRLMAAFLKKGLPEEYQSMMSSFVKISSREHKMDYVCQISDDWKSSSSINHQKTFSKKSDDTRIQLTLVDDSHGGESHGYDIGSSTTLKTLFNDYAEKRGVSLRLLRFSYHGKTLFLSSVGNKTPEDFSCMHGKDVIHVHNASGCQEPISHTPQEPSNNSFIQVNAPSTPKKTKAKKKAKVKPSKPPIKHNSIMTIQEHKAEHSKVLTKLHEEVQIRLKVIRNRLNALDLECQPPKEKKKTSKRHKQAPENIAEHILPKSWTGGKAGKPYFIVQIGEIENLYKTKKSLHFQHFGADTMIDLHGYTKIEALDTLNEKLPGWVESAMEGDYPWVMPVKIVCGCGNQILSETIQDWIKSEKHVSNAPKTSI